MSQKNNFVIIMIWITVLTVWAVTTIAGPLNNKVVTVNGIPHHPIPQAISTVQIDKDTVWIFDANSNYIRVITHDEDGYHITDSEMTFESIESR
ncbi:hypothetical protein [Paenibacillus brevis]|uniref:Uncharacterized protein n=1 Tax=Paenibacillus brevis TaxID=2841508 RepID=A0ABS6FPH8_9BACL|nr:hypothetical protein [Paenibacillus brevis]MBU5672130.1 hypothetical protein [Paenibacillus brevis]